MAGLSRGGSRNAGGGSGAAARDRVWRGAEKAAEEEEKTEQGEETAWRLSDEQIFAILSDTLVEIQEQVLDGDDDDSDWEEVSHGDGGIPRDIIYSSNVPSNANPSVEHLDIIANVFNEDDSYEGDLMKSDPLNEIKLADFRRDFFLNLSNSDKLLFDYLCQSLTNVQRSAVEKVLNGVNRS